jgi:cell division protein FtsI (penicillin-binding protein 3)
MQMIRAMGAIANGGRLMAPRLVRRVVDNAGHVVEDFPPRVVRRVVGQQAIADITRALEMVVTDEGTAVKAQVPGFRVAGKTGTAHMLGAGGYAANRYRASFIGFVPVQNPRLVIYVVINDPAKAKYGGLVSAPVFSAIARQVLPYLGVEATEPIVASSHGSAAEAVASAAEEEADEVEVIDPQAKPWWLQSQLGNEPAQQQILVPDLRGKPLSEVVAEAGKLGVDLDVEGDGLVTGQEPKAGATMSPEGRLSVTLSLPGEPPSVAEAKP